MNNHARRQKLDQELSNLLKSVSVARRRRARVADLMPKGKHLTKVQALFKREHEEVGKLTRRKERVERLLTVAKRVERKSQDRKYSR